MELPQHVIDALMEADAKALATFTETDVNVIPVSSVRVVDGKIWLINYFLDKTLQNILQNPKGSLTFWKGFEGYQIKATIAYHTKGEMFERAVQWIKEVLPDRTVKGLVNTSYERIRCRKYS